MAQGPDVAQTQPGSGPVWGQGLWTCCSTRNCQPSFIHLSVRGRCMNLRAVFSSRSSDDTKTHWTPPPPQRHLTNNPFCVFFFFLFFLLLLLFCSTIITSLVFSPRVLTERLRVGVCFHAPRDQASPVYLNDLFAQQQRLRCVRGHLVLTVMLAGSQVDGWRLTLAVVVRCRTAPQSVLSRCRQRNSSFFSRHFYGFILFLQLKIPHPSADRYHIELWCDGDVPRSHANHHPGRNRELELPSWAAVSEVYMLEVVVFLSSYWTFQRSRCSKITGRTVMIIYIQYSVAIYIYIYIPDQSTYV